MDAIYNAAKDRSPIQKVSNFHDDPTFENLMKQFSFRADDVNLYKEFVTPLTFREDTTLLQFAKEGHIDQSLFALSDDELQSRLLVGAEFLLNHDFVAERSSDLYASKNFKQRFMKHYENTKDLLLAGPPNANHHDINPERAAAWVAAQITEERRRLAQRVVNALRYISHAELIVGIQSCISQLEEQYDRDLPVIFIVGEQSKSNYYVSLLFTHFWLERGNRLDFVIPSITKFYNSSVFHLTGNIFDIDDMGYSGTQTTDNLNRDFQTISEILGKSIRGKITDPTILSFLPRFLVEYALGQIGFQYYLVRIFTSTASLEEWKTYAQMPHRFITHEVIPTLREQVGEQDAILISAVFNIVPPATAVYFDHKVADGPSTLLFPIAYGIVPGKQFIFERHYPNLKPSAENMRKISAPPDASEMPTFIPFINNCVREVNVDVMDKYGDDNTRCPFAWYKNINYISGTYKGVGGSRRRRKTVSNRKQRRRRTQKRRR